MVNYKLGLGRTYPLGISVYPQGFNIAVSLAGKKECGILLYKEGENTLQIPFSKEFLTGNLYTIMVEGIKISEYTYQFYQDDEIVTDPFAKVIFGRETWGDFKRTNKNLFCKVLEDSFDWEGDRPLEHLYSDSIFYGLHIRGFTKHASSGVKGKGCFVGVTEKIPYLKELGITGIVTMPMYEFDEILKNPSYVKPNEVIKPFYTKNNEEWEYKLNYWGFVKGDYFTPKSSYSYSDDSVTECREMIKALHKNGIEVLMRMYFPDDVPQSLQYEVLKFWVINYHIDGFFIMGNNIPIKIFKDDPLLGRTKIVLEAKDSRELEFHNKSDSFKNMGICNERFMYMSRKFLKGDEDMLRQVVEVFNETSINNGIINYITDYKGFTLHDLVSYDKKYNEDNGEKNRDGNDYNYSWNCGAEGITRKKQVLELRKRQVKNAWMMLLLAQGTPMILSGDEFGNSAKGNNNPYCQDNAITWLNWRFSENNKKLLEFVKSLILIRKSHPILHKEEPLRAMDYISCGYPDISYHGEMAWYPQFENYNRHIGILYCGNYAKIDRRKDDDFFYVAYNMHWAEHEFALPKLSDHKKWYIVHDTGKDIKEMSKPYLTSKQSKIKVQPRTIMLLIGKKDE